SPSRDVKTAPLMRAAPQSAVIIVPANHCTETRRRSTNPLDPPSTDSGGSLPSSLAAARRNRNVPRGRIWSQLALPTRPPSEEARKYLTQTPPARRVT